MSNRKKDANIHTVMIQQTYWMKDTSEEKILAMGAIQLGKVVEQVEYYDTDLYDLAVKEMWLSKIGREWKLIMGKGAQNSQNSQGHLNHEVMQIFNSIGSNKHSTKTFSKPSERQKNDSITDQNGNRETVDQDGNRIKVLTCYAIEQEKEIIDFLSHVLHVPGETSNIAMEDFLQAAGIQRYVTNSNITQETFRLPGDFTILLKTEGTTSKKTAIISLDVDIENVARGFQRMEQLANELDLQLQSV
ncbi:uncharacterized protein [Pyxicephalus adspersus]|uniref:uncharacterized protein n=1 Tax=Pyxicephalus adspersus TaxID=30357 RepID=UPI003B59E776